MKQVTMESVKQRIAVLESAGKIVGVLGLGGEFELACLRELVAVTEQRDAVAAELSEVKEQNSEIMKHAYRSKSYLDNNRAVDAAMGLSCAIEVKQRKTPYADYAIAVLRAEGVDSAVVRIMMMMNHQNDVVSKVINILQMHASELRSKSVSAQQDRQLRESKGEVKS